MLKNPPVNSGDTGDAGWILGLERPHGGGNGNPLTYSCLKSPMMEEPGGLQFIGLQNSQIRLIIYMHTLNNY